MTAPHEWQPIATFGASDGIGTTRIFWCRNTGVVRVETTSDGRYRAGGGPIIYTPAPPAATLPDSVDDHG